MPQGYNAQIVTTEDQIIVAAKVTATKHSPSKRSSRLHSAR
jgi:hypothetical protein